MKKVRSVVFVCPGKKITKYTWKNIHKLKQRNGARGRVGWNYPSFISTSLLRQKLIVFVAVHGIFLNPSSSGQKEGKIEICRDTNEFCNLLLVVAMRWKRKIRPWLGLDEQELQRNAFDGGCRACAMVTSDEALGTVLEWINNASGWSINGWCHCLIRPIWVFPSRILNSYDLLPRAKNRQQTIRNAFEWEERLSAAPKRIRFYYRTTWKAFNHDIKLICFLPAGSCAKPSPNATILINLSRIKIALRNDLCSTLRCFLSA